MSAWGPCRPPNNETRFSGRNDNDQMRKRKAWVKMVSAAAEDPDVRLDAYMKRVMFSLAYQVAEIGGACPPFVTIPEPADAEQSDYVSFFVQQWARERFDAPRIEVRLEHDDQSRSVQ